MILKEYTCCFTGHRCIPVELQSSISELLKQEIEGLINKGVIYFATGGALGFDTMAALSVLGLKNTNPQIKLILVLPCKEQADKWSMADKEIYFQILHKADKILFTSEHYTRYCKKHGKISKFRVDRMTKVKLTENDAYPMPNNFNGADYAKNVFSMYDGEAKTVELKCINELMKVIIDKFGEEVETKPLGSNCFKAIVDVSVSPTFFGWVFQFAGNMSILAPEDVKNQYFGMIKKTLEK